MSPKTIEAMGWENESKYRSGKGTGLLNGRGEDLCDYCIKVHSALSEIVWLVSLVSFPLLLQKNLCNGNQAYRVCKALLTNDVTHLEFSASSYEKWNKLGPTSSHFELT